jgi:hypothetical protein
MDSTVYWRSENSFIDLLQTITHAISPRIACKWMDYHTWDKEACVACIYCNVSIYQDSIRSNIESGKAEAVETSGRQNMKYDTKIAVCNPYHIEEMFMIYGDVDGLLNWFKRNDKSWQSLPDLNTDLSTDLNTILMALREMYRAWLNYHGSFPLDKTNDKEKAIHNAMSHANSILTSAGVLIP